MYNFRDNDAIKESKLVRITYEWLDPLKLGILIE